MAIEHHLRPLPALPGFLCSAGGQRICVKFPRFLCCTCSKNMARTSWISPTCSKFQDFCSNIQDSCVARAKTWLENFRDSCAQQTQTCSKNHKYVLWVLKVLTLPAVCSNFQDSCLACAQVLAHICRILVLSELKHALISRMFALWVTSAANFDTSAKFQDYCALRSQNRREESTRSDDPIQVPETQMEQGPDE